MKSDFRLVQFMRDLSLSSSYHSFKVGAAVFFKRKIVSTGLNQSKTHPYVKQNGPNYSSSVHAELDAIFKAERKNPDLLKGSTLVVYREDKEGNMTSARPCPMCMEKIRSVGVKKIAYSTKEGMVTEKVTDFKDEYSENYESFYPQCIRNKAV